MRTVSYQIEYQAETESYIVYEFETRHTPTGEEHEVHSVGPDFATRHEAQTFIRDLQPVDLIAAYGRSR